jgi:glycine/D-amino acid oxidase-like deaminating enzyme
MRIVIVGAGIVGMATAATNLTSRKLRKSGGVIGSWLLDLTAAALRTVEHRKHLSLL